MAAVSKPSMSGMLTSSRMTAKSCSQQLPQRLRAGAGRDEVLAQVLQDRLVDQQLLRQVVHDQDVDLVVVMPSSSRPLGPDRRRSPPIDGSATNGPRQRCSHARSTASICSVSTGLER